MHSMKPSGRPRILTASQTIRTMIELVHETQIPYTRICLDNNINQQAFYHWRNGYNAPSILIVESILQHLGYKLEIVPLNDNEKRALTPPADYDI